MNKTTPFDMLWHNLNSKSRSNPLICIAKKRVQHQLLALPKDITKAFTRLPSSFQSWVTQTTLSNFFAKQLADESLRFLEEHWLAIIISNIPYQFFISVREVQHLRLRNQSIVVKTQIEQEPDVTFSCDIDSLISIALREQDPDTLFFQRKLLVTGNTELGLQVKNFLDELDTSTFPSLVVCALTKYNDVVQASL
ncbi:ubiquinone anaerobic biosynthesis accessory factor UbiT [Aestuariibacter salexigens]|uniref:ubiquinone anaerobic biosynthesis accessory factor UbiT n=1 Tax=Aestuariibacter salexigens TaxID=226010 RepID=UPI0003F5D41F|nr:SCP2 sterol-binding domain-containing protein [Aestuariibacter salexigens]